ncbi:MAG: SRPBCC domain-containing protein [Candidatus Limnocylindria bacterium]
MKTIRQTATIRGATPHDIYETIMDSKKHTKLSRQPTTVSRKVGGAFKVGHDLEGKHLALTKDRRIVQTWRANSWAKGHYSKATFRIAKAAGGTRIMFTQTGVPDDKYGEISKGWREYYWTPLRQQFTSRRARGR